MELVEIDVVGLQQLQRLFELRARFVPRSTLRLAGKEAVLAIGRERGSQPLLGIAVAGRDIEVIHTTVHSFSHDVAGRARLLVHRNNPTEADDGNFLAGPAKRSAWDDTSRRGRHRVKGITAGEDCGTSGLTKERTTFHKQTSGSDVGAN